MKGVKAMKSAMISALCGMAMLCGIAADVEVMLIPGGCHGIFEPGETPELMLVVSNKTDRGMRMEMNLRTIDYFGNTVATGVETLDVGAKRRG